MYVLLFVIAVIAVVNILNGFLQHNDSEKYKNFSRLVPWLSAIGAVLAGFLAFVTLSMPDPTMLPLDGMLTNESPMVRFTHLEGAKVYVSMENNEEPIDSGVDCSDGFIPESEGNYHFQVKFLWRRGKPWTVYLTPASVNDEQFGTQDGQTSETASDDVTGNENDDVDTPTDGLETSKISQLYMPSEDEPPNNITWGWGDTTEGGQGRTAYTLDQINNGELGNRIVFDSITDSVIGDERNFVAARINDGNHGKDNIWNSNLIEVEPGNDYIIRLYGHNNSPYGYDSVARDIQAQFMIPEESGRTIVVHGMIQSSNADPDRYWDSVVFTCKDRFHLEVVEDSALIENKGVGAGGGAKLPIGRVDEKVQLRGCLIDEASVGKDHVQPMAFSYLRFSPDNAYLAAYGNKRISIYSLLNDNKPFVYTTGADIGSMAFCEDYLFAVTRGYDERILVFLHNRVDEGWRYVGVIDAPSDSHSSLLNDRLRSIILDTSHLAANKDEQEAIQNSQDLKSSDTLHFYYNNREIVYSPQNCERTGNFARQHAWENQIDGIDITFLAERGGRGGQESIGSGRRGKKKRKKSKETGISCIAEHKGLRAEAAIDGGLVVYSGAEVYHILERGTTLLKDGAISGDGSTAVTLSYDIFDGNRRVQVWDLDEKRRMSELRCPGEISHIHLSDSGRWIIGIAAERTWTYDRENTTEEWYDEHFISSQRSKVSSYGDKVIRKGVGGLYLFDLGTKKSESVDDGVDSGSIGSIACIMEDGSIATTDKRGRVARFRNTESGERSEVNSQESSVIGIQDLRGKPFIAVATQDNVISVYHTRTCQRTRKLQTSAGNYMMVVHPEEPVVANSNGHRSFETNNYFDKNGHGRWYPNPYKKQEHPIYGDVLDLAFNAKIHELVVILSSGEILYCHEKYCRYHSSTDIIISFDTNAYDFRGCKCSKKIRELLYQNGAQIEIKLTEALKTDEQVGTQTAQRMRLHVEKKELSPDFVIIASGVGIDSSCEVQAEMMTAYDEMIESGLRVTEAWERVIENAGSVK